MTKKEADEYINPASIPEEPTKYEGQKSAEGEAEKVNVVGDTVAYTAPLDSELDDEERILYTINDYYVLNNINDLGLNKDDFNDISLIDSHGNVEEDYRLVALDLTVENESYPGWFHEDADDTILFIERKVGFKEGIEDPNGPWLSSADYFKDHLPLDKNDGSDFYKFILPIGDKIDTTVGWILPADQLKQEPLYYIIGSAGRSEDFTYFKLDFEEGANGFE